MAKMSKVDAQNKFIMYYGNRFAGVDGTNIWQLVGWELIDNGDSNSLHFIIRDSMTGNPNKIPFETFRDDYTNIGTDPNPPKQMDGISKTDVDDLSSRLGLMSEEEEREFNRRYQAETGGTPPPPATPEAQPKVSSNPIHILLDGRKNKPTVKIPIEYEMEFIDDFFYKLIEQSYNDSLDSVIDYFIDSVDMDSVKKAFKDAVEIYIVEKLASDDSIILDKKEKIKNSNTVKDSADKSNPVEDSVTDKKSTPKNKLTVVQKK